MVAERDRGWIGLEYFCNEGDELWQRDEEAIKSLACHELVKLNLAGPGDVLDTKVIKVEKAYPAYHGSYGQFDSVRRYLDTITNLYPEGRNGMHRYNNQDHSMVSAKLAVTCILDSARNKSIIWDVNVEQEYYEEGKATISLR
jgi:protoporphyrinogen oxidase